MVRGRTTVSCHRWMCRRMEARARRFSRPQRTRRNGSNPMSQALEEKTASISADQVADGETTRLRVAHVVLSLNVGGLERNVINQVREGQALGQAVSVICLEE